LDEADRLLTEHLSGPARRLLPLGPVAEWMHARVLLSQGRTDEAKERAEAVLKAGSRIPNPWYVARAHLALARVACAQARRSDADRHAYAGLDGLVEHGYALDEALALDVLAEVAAGLESHEEAARLLGASARARSERGLVRWQTDTAHLEALANRLRETLGEAGYAESFAEGGELSTADAIAWARRARGNRNRPSAGWESLTPTELQVVRLVAEGLTNPQIGERMFIARGTVKVHLSNVLRKLSMSTRTEVATEVARRAATGREDLGRSALAR
jgi:DNA-binding CsgD family transcriptional regulator